ncbi:MAG: hybrid sensor histidine kinase/response regulator [Isosphaeraceae bacterium]|nr:hybrid sensor histidine kinase/response regulator [Isosphaeraceae bacterium]
MSATLPTLLVVDDEPEVLQSIQDLLRREYQVVRCERGADAIQVLESDRDVHVVMSDQRMPGMSGVELLRHAKHLRPDATRLLFTAYADIKAVIDAINEGNVFQYIHKPWNPEELQAVVRKAVEQHDLVVERNGLIVEQRDLLAERDGLICELQETNQRLRDANRLKGAFIEVASHELNTPVMIITGSTELWKMTRSETAEPEDRQYVDRIHNAGKRLEATIGRMLKLIESHELELRLELHPTDLGPLLRNVIADFEHFLCSRRQHVEVEIDPELGSAEVDPLKLTDILTNLVGNAIKFTPDGGTIRVTAGPLGEQEVRFVVVDEGAGIAPNDRKHLFEPFFTGFDTMHHSSGDYQFGKRGIGLGLCLVKSFVALHGGRIAVDTEPGKGSSFAIILPRQQRPPSALSALAG